MPQHDHVALLSDDPVEKKAVKGETVVALRKLKISLALCFIFAVGEFLGGYFSGSLAIMTDAAHLLSDGAGLLVSLAAIYLADRSPDAINTFGYHRYEVLGAGASMMLVFVMTTALVYEAVQRVLHPESVDGPIMFGTAAAGFAVNILMLSVLGHGHSHGGGHSHDGGHSHGEGHGHSHGGSKGGSRNIAVYAAFIHVVGDLIQSVGVMIAAVVIWVKPEWHLADPICTFLFSVLVLFSTVNILRSSMGILMNSAPQHVDVPLLLHALQHISGVSNVHDLHVWTLSSQVTAMTVHLVADKPREALSHALRIAKKHGIQHPTVQVEKCGSSDVKACAENCSSCTLKVDLTDTEVKRIMQSCADDHDEAACSSGHGHSHSHGHGHGHGHGAGDKPTQYGTHSPSGEGQRCERLPDLCGDCGKTHLLVSPPQLAQLHEGPHACGGLIMRNPEVPSPTSGSAASSHDTREGLTVPDSPTLEMRDMA